MMRTRSAPIGFGLIVLIALMIAVGGFYFAQLQNVWIDESTQLSGMKLGVSRLLLWLSGMAIPEFGVPADRMPPVSYLFIGWISFNLVCATGAAANVGVADWLFDQRSYWVLSALAGISVSVVWNYVMSSFFTWRRKT